MYYNHSLRKYLDDLSAKLPAPGGGSASALAAALGAALISMVVNFTLGKPKHAKYQVQLSDILRKSEKLRNKLVELIDLDVQAYKSKDARKALDVPFMLCRLCSEAIKLCPELINKGNKNLISDVAVAAVLLESAFTSAYFNVEINLKILADKKLAVSIRKELDNKQKEVKRIRIKTEECVGKIIRG